MEKYLLQWEIRTNLNGGLSWKRWKISLLQIHQEWSKVIHPRTPWSLKKYPLSMTRVFQLQKNKNKTHSKFKSPSYFKSQTCMTFSRMTHICMQCSSSSCCTVGMSFSKKCLMHAPEDSVKVAAALYYKSKDRHRLFLCVGNIL